VFPSAFHSGLEDHQPRVALWLHRPREAPNTSASALSHALSGTLIDRPRISRQRLPAVDIHDTRQLCFGQMPLEERERLTDLGRRRSQDPVESELVRSLPNSLAWSVRPNQSILVEANEPEAVWIPQIQDLAHVHVHLEQRSRSNKFGPHPFNAVYEIPVCLSDNGGATPDATKPTFPDFRRWETRTRTGDTTIFSRGRKSL
jgi:hypothetical protein